MNESSNSALSPVDSDSYRFSLNQKDNDDDDTLLSAHTKRDRPFKEKLLTASDENGIIEPLLSTMAAFSSRFSNHTSVAYDVDWSDRAQPTSHCWFPYKFDSSSAAQPCAYASCANRNAMHRSLVLQCETCALIMHANHLNDLHTINNLIPSCRPSFIENATFENLTADDECHSSNYDRHFWSCVSVLSTPCVYCKRKSMSRSQSSAGLICLWCSRGYHQSCWERCATADGDTNCDYGIFKPIVVRPHWLRRCKEPSSGFQARTVKNCLEPKDFPYTPVIFFVNQNSGGQYGEKIYRQLLRKLNPRQVFLLKDDTTIFNALDIYSLLPNIRICALGGDGTAAWILGCLGERYPSNQNPPMSVYPLGTANDLSLILSRNNRYEPKHLFPSLIRIPQAPVVSIDRWKLHVEQLDGSNLKHQHGPTSSKIRRPFRALLNPPKFVREIDRASYQNHRTLPNSYFLNYMSFGLDAAIALEFHNERLQDPLKFSSPFKNKLMYFNQSCKYLNDISRSKMWSLHSYIRLICDGEDFTDAIRHCHTLLILNIPAYASGTNPWGNSSSTASDRFVLPDFSDGIIEVVGLTATRMASLQIGFHGQRITQCSRVRVELSSSMAAQMDGEPFYLPDSTAVNIDYGGQGLVLRNGTL